MNRTAIIFILSVLPGCGEPKPKPTPTATPPRPAPPFAEVVAPALATYCLGCHESSTGSGGVILAGFEEGPRAGKDLALWGRVAEAIRSGSMPPSGKPGPDPATRSAIVASIDAEVFRCADPSANPPGRVALRRLNRPQYDNTISDLVGLDLRPAGAFPADDLGYGFDNNGDVLSMPPILMEKYLDAAASVVEAVARRPDAWARIMDPGPDLVPASFRKRLLPARSDPVKRIGVPAPQAPPVVDPESAALARASEILRAFADRAFRRPVTDEELARLVGLVESARKDGDDPEEAIRQGLRAILVSPQFLFPVEEDDPGTGARDVNDFELAARLSYFLWNSMPDADLARLAALGQLHRGDVLASEARRLLRDPKATALVDGFALQWLQVRGLGDASPDPIMFPGFDEPLRRAMLRETSLFCEAIIREDRPVFDFLDADYTFIDESLAAHYGLAGVAGPEFRRVSLAATSRRGILTHASILTATSSPTRTSPVRRGRWVLDCLLGSPPPPPPPDAEGLDESAASHSSATLRERMERHRADPRCASCHAKMDPIGFGLENFDAVGGWRDRDGSSPIDASGLLPGGASFRGLEQLQAALAGRREAFARSLAEKLTTYALGRGLLPADRCTIDAIALKLVRDDARFSTLVLAIVESPAFRKRAGHPGDAP